MNSINSPKNPNRKISIFVVSYVFEVNIIIWVGVEFLLRAVTSSHQSRVKHFE